VVTAAGLAHPGFRVQAVCCCVCQTAVLSELVTVTDSFPVQHSGALLISLLFLYSGAASATAEAIIKLPGTIQRLLYMTCMVIMLVTAMCWAINLLVLKASSLYWTTSRCLCYSSRDDKGSIACTAAQYTLYAATSAPTCCTCCTYSACQQGSTAGPFSKYLSECG
jgi:hypothetical protein